MGRGQQNIDLLPRVKIHQLIARMRRIQHHIIEHADAQVRNHLLDMIGQGVIIGLPRLRGRVANVDFQRLRVANRLRYLLEGEAGDHRGKEAARSNRDQIRSEYRVHRRLIGDRLRILHEDAFDRRFVQPPHIELLLDDRAIHQLGADMRVLFRDRINIRPHIQKVAYLVDRHYEAARHLRQRGDEQIAESHAVQLGVARRDDPMLHQARQQRVVIQRQSRQRVADIAGGRYLGELADDAGAAPGVSHGDDAGQFMRMALHALHDLHGAQTTADGYELDPALSH